MTDGAMIGAMSAGTTAVVTAGAMTAEAAMVETVGAVTGGDNHGATDY
jgi:hypothetical protein